MGFWVSRDAEQARNQELSFSYNILVQKEIWLLLVSFPKLIRDPYISSAILTLHYES